MWRSLIAVLGVIVATVSGAGATAGAGPARLTIETSTGSVTSILVPTEATLECDEGERGTGFLGRVETPACALVRKGTLTEIAGRHDVARLCADVYGGPQRAHISGRIGGQRIDLSINRNDGCGIADWNRLQALLGVPERTGVIARRRPSSATTTTTTAPPQNYRVQRGDTVTEIAKEFHTSVGAIVAANQLTDPDHLAEGQNLVMPPPSAVRIEAELVDDQPDSGVDLILAGASPSERVTFVITMPDGSTYTGSPHVASVYGVVTTTYIAEIGSGTYTFSATGEQGTNAESKFHVDPPD